MALLDGTAPWRRAVEPELPVQDTGVYPSCPTYWTATTPPLHSRRRRLPRRSPSTACSIRCPRPRSPVGGQNLPDVLRLAYRALGDTAATEAGGGQARPPQGRDPRSPSALVKVPAWRGCAAHGSCR